MSAVLKAENISITFGGLKAVVDFNMELNKGELVGLIGPNGAGKTTVFNMLTGVYKPTLGKIYLNKDNSLADITGLKSYQITCMGIARTFQNIRLFKDMTVIDNVRTAYHSNIKYSPLDAVLRTPRYRNEEKHMKEMAMELLGVFNINSKANEFAKNLPYGEQRKLEIVRALATNPSVLLLDEPAAGMNPQETQELNGLIKFIRDKYALTILLIEHDMSLVMNICEKIIVLDHGSVISQGSPEIVSQDPKVITAYLGEEV